MSQHGGRFSMAKGKLRLYAPAVNPSNDMKRERKLIGVIVLTAVDVRRTQTRMTQMLMCIWCALRMDQFIGN